MDTLRIRWAGGDAAFEPGTTVRVGRDADAEVQPNNSNVSRRHVEITHGPSGWMLRDVGSAQGTWRDGRQVETVDIRGTVQVTLGREGRGEVLTLEAAVGPFRPPVATELAGSGALTGPTQIVGGPVSHGAPSAGGEGTVVVGGGGGGAQRPGGVLREEAIAGATVVTGDVLNVECAGRSYSFRPGQQVAIGRDAACEVVSSNPTVSRRHATIVHDGTGWTLRDEGSSGGTFVDGKRITAQRLQGSVAAWLGDASTGERLVIVASGTNPAVKRKKNSRRLLVAGAVVGVVALAAVAALVVTRFGGGGGGRSEDDLGRGTVRLVAGEFAGSGTVVDAELGLILTNAHVVAPDAPGSAVRDGLFDLSLDPTPREVTVLVAPALGKSAEPAYIAEVVAVDGYLDLAVIKITETIGGRIVEGPDDMPDLVEIEVGDSSKITTGDDIRVFGYPGAAQSTSVTLTEGVVSGPVADARLSSNDAMLNISAAINPGNSGGLAVNADGELVGIPSIIRDDAVPSMRPSEFAIPLIEAAREGTDYPNPFYRSLTTEKIENIGLVAPGDAAGINFECTTGSLEGVDVAAAGALGLAFDFEGFEPGLHQDLLIALFAGDEVVGMWALHDEYPVRWAAEKGCATVTVPVDTTLVSAGALDFLVGFGPSYKTDF